MKILRKIKNAILVIITVIAVVLFLLSICALDSDTHIPFYVAFGSMGWIFIVGMANKDRFDKFEDLDDFEDDQD